MIQRERINTLAVYEAFRVAAVFCRLRARHDFVLLKLNKKQLPSHAMQQYCNTEQTHSSQLKVYFLQIPQYFCNILGQAFKVCL